MLNKHCVSEKMTSPIAQGLGGSHALLALLCHVCMKITFLHFIQTLDVYSVH